MIQAGLRQFIAPCPRNQRGLPLQNLYIFSDVRIIFFRMNRHACPTAIWIMCNMHTWQYVGTTTSCGCALSILEDRDWQLAPCVHHGVMRTKFSTIHGTIVPGSPINHAELPVPRSALILANCRSQVSNTKFQQVCRSIPLMQCSRYSCAGIETVEYKI